MQTATDLFPWATRALSGRGLAHPPFFTAVNAIAHGARFTPEGCLTRETVRCPSRYQRGTGFSAEPAIRVSGSPAPTRPSADGIPGTVRRNPGVAIVGKVDESPAMRYLSTTILDPEG